MAFKPTFKISDKQILLKLHLAALKKVKPRYDGIFMLNSGITKNGKIEIDADKQVSIYTKIANNADPDIYPFSNKNNEYEFGILLNEDAIKKYVIGFKSIQINKDSQKLTPLELFKLIDQKDKLTRLKKDIEDLIKNYFTVFCGDEYAKSIQSNSIIGFGFPTINEAAISDNWKLGACTKKIDSMSVILYKICYSVGKNKAQ